MWIGQPHMCTVTAAGPLDAAIAFWDEGGPETCQGLHFQADPHAKHCCQAPWSWLPDPLSSSLLILPP